MGKDLDAGADRASAAAAIAALGPAIELVDLDRPPERPEDILSGNIYHRHVLLGARARAGAGLDGLRGRVSRNGSEIASVADLEANTGELLVVVAQVASLLAAFGERLRADDVVICGSVVPPIAIEPLDRAVGFGFDTASDVTVAIVA
jgi:2-keto-4-pentenoate hydratase